MSKLVYDIVICGGGVAGSVFALQMRNLRPECKILILEQSTVFPKKVGESSSDITGVSFREFGIDHLQGRQKEKAGLRFMFSDGGGDLETALDYSSPSFRSPTNGWQMNRSDLDHTLLQGARDKGCEVWRPAQVLSYEYLPFETRILVKKDEAEFEVTAKWMIDASGRRGIVANKEDWRVWMKEPDTASSWAHFSGTQKIPAKDGPGQEYWEKNAISDRQDATTHLMGEGYWVWHIPLNDDTVSIGVVYDKRIVDTQGLHPRDFFYRFVAREPLLKGLVENSSNSGFRHLPHLPFCSKRYLKPGLALIGDAANFIDPLYSPGIEITCQQVNALSHLVSDNLRTGRFSRFRQWVYERNLRLGYETRIELYKKKYYFMGDYEVYSLISQWEIATYFSFYLFPAVLFRPLLRVFPKFNWISFGLYRLFTAHLMKAVEFRKTLSPEQRKVFSRQTYTGARVPKLRVMPWASAEMLSKAVFKLVLFEAHLFKHRLLRVFGSKVELKTSP